MTDRRDEVLRRRLATQRLTATPFDDPADAVRLLLAVQAQDAPLARFSIGLRTGAATDATVRAALDAGRIIRTHVLRPTWHVVAAEDLRWLLALTSPKVESGMAARHRQLALDGATIDRALQALADVLRGQALTRTQIGAAFAELGLPQKGETLGHLVLIAELRGVICSGPLSGVHHTYALVDERIPVTPGRDRHDAVRELVARFYAGHGPAAITDLTRWTAVTQAEIKSALADLDDALATIEIDGSTLWFDPAATTRRRRNPPAAFLLPTFDETVLTYPSTGFSRAAGHPRGTEPHRFAEAGGGVVIVDRQDVGAWKRVERPDEVLVTAQVATTLGRDQRDAIEQAARRLAHHVGKPLRLDVS